MDPQVFLDRQIDVGDTVFYNDDKFIVLNVNKKTLRSVTSGATCTLNKKQFKTITIDPYFLHEYAGETIKQKLTHAFGYIYHDLDRKQIEIINENFESLASEVSDAALASIANEKHNLLCKVKDGVYQTCNETFFEYAYRHKVFSYCDTCIEYWLSTFKDENITNHLSLISQPPMNSVITDPVLCIFRGERNYDRTRIFEKLYVEKTIEKNEQNSMVEEPAYAVPMTADEFWDIQDGDEVIIQIDAYDVHFLNTKLMTNKQFLHFINDGHHIKENQSFEQVFPITKHRLGAYGIHFVSKPTDATHESFHAPLKLFNFYRFRGFIIDYVLCNCITQDLYEGDIAYVKQTFEFPQSVTKDENSVTFFVSFDEKKSESEDDNEHIVVWFGEFTLKTNSKNDIPLEMIFTLKRAQMEVYTEAFNVLLFVTDNEYQPLRLINNALNLDYEHETERHVKRATVVEKFLGGTDDDHYTKVRLDNGEQKLATINSETIPAPSPSNRHHRKQFHDMLKLKNSEIQFKEKSYALVTLYIGMFSIPSTVYYPNQYRLSNGKIPKSCKQLKNLSFKKKHSDGSKETYLSYFYSCIKKIKDIIPVVPYEVETIPESPIVTMEILSALIEKDKLVEFHDLLSKLPFAEKNKFIMKLRTMSFKYPTNKIIMCAMNRNTSIQMSNKESLLDAWTSFLEGKTATMPSHIGMFLVQADALHVTPYVKKKMMDKVGDKFYITPLILAILLKKVSLLPETVFQHCQNIQVTDYEYYPIHFIVHFCDSSAFRLAYVKMIFQKEMPNNEFFKPFTKEFKSLNQKWNPNKADTHALLYALSEWPFDELYQLMFLTSFAVSQKYTERDWFKKYEEARQLFAHIPGNYVVEQKMKAYGYPQMVAPAESFVDSWTRGFSWLAEISLMFKDDVDLHITSLNMLKNAKRSTDGYIEATAKDFKLLRSNKREYFQKQQELFHLYEMKLRSNDDPDIFDKIFCSGFNIHFKFLREDQSMYELLLQSPELWQTGYLSCATVGKLSNYYLKVCPNFSDTYFEDVECQYYYMRLSLFSQYITVLVNNKKTACTESTVLCRAGGNLKQLKFVAGLQGRQLTTCEFKSIHIQNMFTEKLRLDELSAYIYSNHHIHSWRENLFFGVDLVEYLTIGDGFVSDRVKKIIQFIELYMHDNVWNNRIKWHKNFFTYYHEQYDNLDQYQLRFIRLLQNINKFLITVTKKLSLIDQGSLIMLQILTCSHWTNTYLKGIMALKKTNDRQPHLMSYVNMYHSNTGITRNISWKDSLIYEKTMQYEIYAILRSPDVHTFDIFKNALLYIEENILQVDANLVEKYDEYNTMNYMIRKYNRVPDRRYNYDFVGSALMDLLARFKRRNETFDVIHDSRVKEILDQLMFRVISQCCCDYRLKELNQDQTMNFLYTLLASSWSNLSVQLIQNPMSFYVNKIIEMMLTYELTKSLLLFVKALELHMDYHFLNFVDNNICKHSKIDYVQPQECTCELSTANTKLLLSKFMKEGGSNRWFAIVVKLHFNGIINWNLFSDLANFKHGAKNMDLGAVQLIHQDHKSILTRMQRNSNCYFDTKKFYAVSFFVQNGLNPFLFDFMKPNKGNVDWVSHLLKYKLTIDGWPFNMYFPRCKLHKQPTERIQPYLMANYSSEIAIDNFFTVNEGLEDLYDYTYRMFTENSFYTVLQTGQNNRHKISGRYILETSTFLSTTILAMYQQKQPLQFKTVMSLITKVHNESGKSLLDILMFPHACIKSQIEAPSNKATVVHCKVNMLSLLELLCTEFSVSDLDILLEKIPQITSNVRLLKENMKFSLLFSDNIEMFNRYFQVYLLLCSQPTDIFSTFMVSIHTTHRFLNGTLYYFNLDILTFVCQYGRNKHLQYFIEYIKNKCGNKIKNLQERIAKQSSQSNLELSEPHLFYIHVSRSPLVHLLYVCAIHGHENCFHQIFDFIKELPAKVLKRDNMSHLIHRLARVLKFDPSRIEVLQNLLARRRSMLKTLLSYAEENNIVIRLKHQLHASLKHIVLNISKEVIPKPSHFIVMLHPHIVTNNKNFMRCELQVTGEHIFSCFKIMETVYGEEFKFTMKEIVNLALLCSHELFEFAMSRRKGDDNYKEFNKSIDFDGGAHDIIDFLKQENMYGKKMKQKYACDYILLYYILSMEISNSFTSIEEIKSNLYLKLIFDWHLTSDFDKLDKLDKFLNEFFEDKPIVKTIKEWYQQYSNEKGASI